MSDIGQQAVLDFRLRDDATFSNYVGDAAKNLQLTTGMAFIWGEAGSGKSHLLQAFCHAEPSSIFLSDLPALDASILRGLESFKLVCIDDVDKVVADRSWQEALFHLINDCLNTNNLLVLSSGTANEFASTFRRSRTVFNLVIAVAVVSCSRFRSIDSVGAHNPSILLVNS